MLLNGKKYEEVDANSLKDLTDLLANFRIPQTKTKEQAWFEFESRIVSKNKVAKKRSLNYLVYAIAASIALFISISTWYYYDSEVKIWCEPANNMTVSLPDGSQVLLNAASKLNYNKISWNKLRSVHLEGEAFFHVKKGSRFEVVTSVGTIMVLGTSFNVFARNNRLEVYCETGKVAVVESKNMVLLVPGQKAQAMNNSLVCMIKAEQKHEASWQQGDFWFHNAPLSEVIAEMERQFDVTIKFNNLSNRYYTGYFNRGSLAEALNYVFDPMQVKYKIENKTIQIIN